MEIESLAAFDTHLRARPGDLTRCRIQAVDLVERGWELRSADVADAVFLGCVLSESVAGDLRQRGALVFPQAPHLPFDPYRSVLYTPQELYEGIDQKPYEQTPDALAHAWGREDLERENVLDAVLHGLHDASITDLLRRYVAGKRVVGMIGGHSLARDSYSFREAARLGRALARAGFTVATSGGPGAMEAANLGAYLAPHADSALDDAIGVLEAARGAADVTAWVRAAFAVRAAFPAATAGESLAVPTWSHGHQPPNAFATGIAKFLGRAARDDWFLGGSGFDLMFLPGAAGTVRDVFEAAAPLYYSPIGAPTRRLILVGTDHWTRKFPVWPLMRALSYSRPMATTIHLVDTPDEAATLLTAPRR
jgi:predicted Rossmann-fold nucleotide-binding protein